MAARAGLADVRIRGEELLANWFGWANRALEATADPDTVPWGWKVYAFKGYLAFQELDRRLLEPHLPRRSSTTSSCRRATRTSRC